MEITAVPINSIIVKDRFRKELRNIDVLAESMKTVGQLQPIVIDRNHKLICGERRIRACQLLGYETIDAVMLDIDDRLRAERDENECNEQFTPSERLDIAKAMEARERELAKERMAEAARGGHLSTPSEQGKTRDKIAVAAGLGSSMTMRRVEKVVNDGIPEVVEAMDAKTLTVNSAYQIALKPKDEQKSSMQAIQQPKARRAASKTKATIPKHTFDQSRLYAEGSPISAKSTYRRVEKEIELMGKDDPHTLPVLKKIIDICQNKIERLTGELQ